MSKIITDFKALSLDAQTEAFPAIFAAFNASKDARREELEAQVRQLGFKAAFIADVKLAIGAGVLERRKLFGRISLNLDAATTCGLIAFRLYLDV
ncbi:hypothetical protein [Rhodopseudomonas sp. RCAM05734]|uniref:hypothetical protein n=1 Tax=Rhodopseudomonas sp. RCAM05734 TaxID=3457549 RepID=UPI0040450E66